ncbi:hypothetical protein [Mycobacterium sp. C31M]
MRVSIAGLVAFTHTSPFLTLILGIGARPPDWCAIAARSAW